MNATEATKNERKEVAREKARLMREAEKKRRLRNRLFVQGGVLVAILAIAAVVVLIIATTKPPPAISGGPANMISDGILLKGSNGTIVAETTPGIATGAQPTPTDANAHTNTINVVTYIDLFCPRCQEFESANAQQLEDLVSKGAITLEIHPIQILDSSSQGTRYSSRAVNAAACVANYQPNSFVDVTDAFYVQQPKEQTTGLTNDEIVKLVQGAGVKDDAVKQCITHESFKDWVTASTNRALKGPLPNSSVARVTGTPTVLVNGQLFQGPFTDPSAFRSFMETVSAGN